MALERTYTIPLRTGWLKSPKYRRAKKAVSVIKQFLVRHMKSEDVRLGTHLNEELWKHGIKNPPSKVKVNVVKDDKGVVRAELPGFKFEEKKVEEKKGIVKKLTEKVAGKKEEKKPEVTASVEPKPVQKKPEVKKEEPKVAPKEEKPAAKPAPKVEEKKEAPKAEKKPEAEKKEVKAEKAEAKEEPKAEKPAQSE